MIIGIRRFILVVLFAVTTGHAHSAFATSTLALLPSGDGSYALQGITMENAAAMDVTITYDAATLASPRVTQGAMISGAMMAVNDTVPGTIRMGVVRTTPVKGTGVIATITFTRKGADPGKILGMKASLSSIDSKPLPVIAQIGSQADTASDTSNPSGEKGGAAATGQSAGSSQTTGIKASGPAGGAGDKASLPVSPSQETGAISGEVGPSSTVSADARGITAASDPSGKKIQQYEGVLTKFKKYKGDRTSAAFIKLFQQEEMIGFRQDPPVALSDGKTPVRATFLSSSGEKTASDIAVIGARLVSMKKDPDNTNTWIVELMPEKGAYEASFAVSDGALKRIYPLTISPVADMKTAVKGVVSEKDLENYLAGPRQDVNHDGKKDYLDDYIVTANYLMTVKGTLQKK